MSYSFFCGLPFLLQAQQANDCKAFVLLISEIDAQLDQNTFSSQVSNIFKKLRSAQVKANDCDPSKLSEVEQRYRLLFTKIKEQKKCLYS